MNVEKHKIIFNFFFFLISKKKKHSKGYSDATLFANDFIDYSLTIYEQCVVILDLAAQESQEKDFKKLNLIFVNLIERTFQPKSDLDNRFLRSFGHIIKEVLKFRNNIKSMLDLFKKINESCLETTNKLKINFLQRFNDKLANHRKFFIVISGIYQINNELI